ncbi:MAG: hypothetical protein JJE04_11220 [Acidobacteriia bacterium]|nr:hypothetical protein [Terriglobia bacterium]
MRHYDQDELTLLYYGEAGADGHLGRCLECQEQMKQLSATLDRVREWPVPLRPADYPTQVWEALAPQIGLSRKRRAFPWLGAGAAIAAMLVLAFQLGRHTAPGPAATRVADPSVGERIRDAAIGDHLEQSRFVLAELANANGNDAMELSAGRRRASELLQQNRLYRQTAALSGMGQVEDTLEDLERLLVELSHASDTSGPQVILHLRKRIEQQQLLFRVRILESQFRHKLQSKEDNL